MRSLLAFLVLFLVLPAGTGLFNKKKVADTFEDVLKDAGLNRKYKNAFLDRGWDSTPQMLRRLSKMDLLAVGMNEKEIKKMYASIDKLVPKMEKKASKNKKIDKALELRKSLNYGRLYIDGASGSFQFMKAAFGGDIPLKSFEVVFGGDGCKEVNNAAGSMLVVMRGECTYLQKAEAAEESGASVLIVVNSDNTDLFQLPAGHNLSAEELDDLPVIPTVLVQKSALKTLQMLQEIDPFAKGMLIPQVCEDDGCAPVYRSDKAYMSHFDATGGELHYTAVDGSEVKMDFVASSFGITVPEEGELVVSSPIESCGGMDKDVADSINGKVVIMTRGGCSFYDKIEEVQRFGARMAIIVDNEEQSILDRIGVTTEQLAEIYLPVLMVSRKKGYEMIEMVKEKDAESMPSIVYISKNIQVGIKWAELRNFFANCIPSDESEKETLNYVQCNRDFEMLRKSSIGMEDREASLKRYKIVDVSDLDEERGDEKEVESEEEGGKDEL